MRSRTLASAAALALAGTALSSAPAAADADGDDRACVTKKEYNLVVEAVYDGEVLLVPGTTFKRVKRIFDSKGTQIGFGIGEPAFTQGWAQCKNRRNGVSIKFEGGSTAEPKATWQTQWKAWAT